MSEALQHGDSSPAARIGSLPEDANVPSLAMYFVTVTRGMELLGRPGVGRAALTAVALDPPRVLHDRTDPTPD